MVAGWSTRPTDRTTTTKRPTGDSRVRATTDPPDDQSATAEAFSTAGSDLRLSLLRALWEADWTLSFSELRAEAGVRDSAQFNYHLQKLTPRFVQKTADGYRLAWPGRYVVKAIRSGGLVGDKADPFPAGGTCIDCHEGLVASYDGDRLSIRCPTCDRLYSTWPFPPGALVDRDEAALLDAYDQWVRHEFALGIRGVCSDCGGRVERSLHLGALPDDPLSSRAETRRTDETGHEGQTRPEPSSSAANDVGALDAAPAGDAGAAGTAPARVRYQCRRCRKRATAHPGMVLLTDPTVRGFHDDHGRGFDTVHYWTLPWAVDDAVVETLDGDPPRVRVHVSLGGETLAATIDESLRVVQTKRTGAK